MKNMCNPLQEVIAYKDCAGDVHATKIQALSSSIATSLSHKHSPYSRISTWDVKQVVEGILDSDELRGYFREAIQDKDISRQKELTRAFCESSKSC